MSTFKRAWDPHNCSYSYSSSWGREACIYVTSFEFQYKWDIEIDTSDLMAPKPANLLSCVILIVSRGQYGPTPVTISTQVWPNFSFLRTSLIIRTEPLFWPALIKTFDYYHRRSEKWNSVRNGRKISEESECECVIVRLNRIIYWNKLFS